MYGHVEGMPESRLLRLDLEQASLEQKRREEENIENKMEEEIKKAMSAWVYQTKGGKKRLGNETDDGRYK